MATIKIKRGIESNLSKITLNDGELCVTTDEGNLYLGFSGQKIWLGQIENFGDMKKDIYDTNNDGIVDQAEKVEWTGVLNKAIATSTGLGLVKIGSNISVESDGTISGNSNPDSFIPKSERFVIQNGQTVFTLKNGYYTSGSLTWILYGMTQPKNSIIEIDSTNFEIPSGLPDGTEFEVHYIQTVNVEPYIHHKDEHLPGGADDLGLKPVALSGEYNDLTGIPYSDEISKKTLIGSTTAAGYYKFAQTQINPTNYSATFKITVTSTANASIGHILYVKVAGYGNSYPTFEVTTKTLSTSGPLTGLYYLRGVFPRAINNGYNASIELYVYDATKRDIKIELIEAENVSLLDAIATSTYNSTYQTITTPTVCYNGHTSNGTYYGSLSGNASSANYLYNANYIAGEALAANDIIFLQNDDKWYKATVAGRNIPLGTIIGRCVSSYSVGSYVGVYTVGYFALPTSLTGTRTEYKDLLIEGALSGNNLVTTGVVTSEPTAGHSYMRIGSMITSNCYLQYDGNNRVYTVGSNGNLIALDNYNLGVPTKLSDLQNDIGAGGGVKITTAATAPSAPSPGDFWYQTL